MGENMHTDTQTQESFEIKAPELNEFATTALSTETDHPVMSTGFSTCPAKTGQYC